MHRCLDPQSVHLEEKGLLPAENGSRLAGLNLRAESFQLPLLRSGDGRVGVLVGSQPGVLHTRPRPVVLVVHLLYEPLPLLQVPLQLPQQRPGHGLRARAACRLAGLVSGPPHPAEEWHLACGSVLTCLFASVSRF